MPVSQWEAVEVSSKVTSKVPVTCLIIFPLFFLTVKCALRSPCDWLSLPFNDKSPAAEIAYFPCVTVGKSEALNVAALPLQGPWNDALTSWTLPRSIQIAKAWFCDVLPV